MSRGEHEVLIRSGDHAMYPTARSTLCGERPAESRPGPPVCLKCLARARSMYEIDRSAPPSWFSDVYRRRR